MDCRISNRLLGTGFLLLVCVVQTAAAAPPPVTTSLTAIHQNPALIGKQVRVHTCFGIPLSDAPGDPMTEFALLYPCDAHLEDMAEDALRNISVLAESAPNATLQSIPGTVWDSYDMEGDFTGTLTRRTVDPQDKEQSYVLVFHSLKHVKARHAWPRPPGR